MAIKIRKTLNKQKNLFKQILSTYCTCLEFFRQSRGSCHSLLTWTIPAFPSFGSSKKVRKLPRKNWSQPPESFAIIHTGGIEHQLLLDSALEKKSLQLDTVIEVTTTTTMTTTTTTAATTARKKHYDYALR